MFGRYTYEIIGGILIFVSSLVGEQMPVKWKRWSYVVFAIFALLYIGIGIALDRDTSKQQGKLEQTITALRTTISNNQAAQLAERKAAESARQSDRDAFLGQFNSLNRQISDIRTNVHTESLRKQLDETQRAVARTQEALEKREVKLDFVINGQVNPTDITAHKEFSLDRYVAPITYGLLNNSNRDVASGITEFKLVCSDCADLRFVPDPQIGWPQWSSDGKTAGRDFLSIPQHTQLSFGKIRIYSVKKQPLPAQLVIAVRYRCLLCVPEDWHVVTVHIAE
jgi:hypothetical protein